MTQTQIQECPTLRKAEKARVEEKLKSNAHYKTQGDRSNSSQAPIVEGGRPVERVWNDGRFAAGLDATSPDYISIDLFVMNLSRHNSNGNWYVGGGISKDINFSSNYGLGARFGNILNPEDSLSNELREQFKRQGIYHFSPRYFPNMMDTVIDNHLQGLSGNVNGCLGIVCASGVTTTPSTIDSKSTQSIEFGVGTGPIGGDIGVSDRIENWRKQFNNKLEIQE